jgi:phosphoribosyl 1,2-cyclic phosphodiesterase
VFLKKYSVPLYASAATLAMLQAMNVVPPMAQLIAVDGAHHELAGGFGVEGFATSHDAAGCNGFRIFMPDGTQMAIATDLGCITKDVYKNLQGAALVALEANYDAEKLHRGPYPAYLKQRIRSSWGHLSNEDSATTVAQLIAEGCHKVALCHLSEENNHPNLVLDAIDSALFSAGQSMPADCVVQISRRHEPSPWIEF